MDLACSSLVPLALRRLIPTKNLPTPRLRSKNGTSQCFLRCVFHAAFFQLSSFFVCIIFGISAAPRSIAGIFVMDSEEGFEACIACSSHSTPCRWLLRRLGGAARVACPMLDRTASDRPSSFIEIVKRLCDADAIDCVHA